MEEYVKTTSMRVIMSVLAGGMSVELACSRVADFLLQCRQE
jgi:hypothetical protein